MVVLPTLPSWKCPTINFTINLPPGKNAVVTEQELHLHFRVFVADSPPSLYISNLYTDGSETDECVGLSAWLYE